MQLIDTAQVVPIRALKSMHSLETYLNVTSLSL